MIRQLNLFDQPPRPVEPRDPKVTAVEAPRLSRQCRAILGLLRERDATNDELSRIARKYTGRVSDLRKAGFEIECRDRDFGSGVSWYRLIFDPERRS